MEKAIDILRDPVDLRPNEGRKRFPCTEYENGNWAIGNNHNVHSAVMKGESLQFWLAAGWDEECRNPVYNPYIGFDVEALLSGAYGAGQIPTYDPPYNGP